MEKSVGKFSEKKFEFQYMVFIYNREFCQNDTAQREVRVHKESVPSLTIHPIKENRGWDAKALYGIRYNIYISIPLYYFLYYFYYIY